NIALATVAMTSAREKLVILRPVARIDQPHSNRMTTTQHAITPARQTASMREAPTRVGPELAPPNGPRPAPTPHNARTTTVRPGNSWPSPFGHACAIDPQMRSDGSALR